MNEAHPARDVPRKRQLTGVMWNVKGLSEMREYIKELVSKQDPDFVLLSETKRRQNIDVSTDLGCDPSIYREFQLNSTVHHRGGLVVILKNSLRVETAELIRVKDGEEFIQGVVLEDKEGDALVLWYSAPTTSPSKFGETINHILSEYNVKLMLGDFNARHPAWCRAHDTKKEPV